MNTLHVFLGLGWAVLSIVALVGGGIVTVKFAQDADYDDVPLPKALGGTILRGLITLLLVALIIGLPLDLMGF